tara:strand:+ start:4179 stop:4598 length:420 start_codon:yes stop_codon:yes gene_type:complete
LNYRELPVAERSRVNTFYQLTSYKRPVSGDDRVFVAEQRGAICGAVRIENRDSVQVLRGMYMLPDRVRQGIGSGLLNFIVPVLAETEAYCIPGDHLFDFYAQVQFRPIETEAAPGFLIERIKGYFKEGKKVAMMHRIAG